MFAHEQRQAETHDVNPRHQGTRSGVVVVERGEQVSDLHCADRGDDAAEVEPEALPARPHVRGEELRQIQGQPAVKRGCDHAYESRCHNEDDAEFGIQRVKAIQRDRRKNAEDGVRRLLGIFSTCNRADAQRFRDGTWTSL